MRVAIVAPTPVPHTWGGAERAVDGLRRAIVEQRGHDVEIVNRAVYERDLVGTITGYADFAALDLSGFDEVISVKYPAWMAYHPRHTVLMFHPLRGLYDTYPAHLPTRAAPSSPKMHALLEFISRNRHRDAVPSFLERFFDAAAALDPGHPDLAFPGPNARELVRWLDHVALSPAVVHRHLALSNTVAQRPGYFPPDVRPRVLHLPAELEPAPDPTPPGRHFFTASRLDGPKRLDLLIRSMEAVEHDVPLLIAGTGPSRRQLQHLAAKDRRVHLLGFVSDDELVDLYRNAIAVPFVPADEDLGLITLEAFSQASPVVTTTDAGGPTEFVRDGVTGIVAEPHPSSIGRALDRLAADRPWARDMGIAGRRRGAEVTWRRAVDTLFPPRPRRRTVEPEPTVAAATEPRPGIVIVSTFGIDDPRHGGQIRARQLYGALTGRFDVHLVALADRCTPGTRQLAPGLVQTVIQRSVEQNARDAAAGSTIGFDVTDILSGRNGELTPAFDDHLRTAAESADAVILAEPYLLPAVERIGIELPMIYDAYNVETVLKTDALPETDLGRSLLTTVEAIEGRAVRDSDVVVACSAADAELLAEIHERAVDEFVVIPNGTSVPAAIPTADERDASRLRWLEHLRREDGDHRIEHLAVFFGSWHPPNLDAARLIIEIAPQHPDVQFVCGGSHGEFFEDRTLPPNVSFPGRVTDTIRRRLLDTASVAINPMRLGSGTNLKLVEYLAAGVPVVSTPFGARGVPVVDGEHLLLAEPDGLSDAISATLRDPAAAHARARAGHDLARGYDWAVLGDRLAALLHRVTGSGSDR